MPGPSEYHWTFGNGCHISFPNGGDPIVEPNHAFNSGEGCAAISDQNGNLLFYTDGTNLYDASHTQINSSTTPLGGDTSAANSAIIVPPAGGGSVYHIFAVGSSSTNQTANNQPLKYTGVTVSGSTVTIVTPTTDVIDPVYRNDWIISESIGATAHSDCSKYWVVGLDATRNEWVKILIDSDVGPIPANISRSDYGAPILASNTYGMKFSSDGTMIAHANAQFPEVNPTHGTLRNRSSVDIFDFDRNTGNISYKNQITRFPDNPTPYGVEFSPGNQYIYFTDYWHGTVYRHLIGTDEVVSNCTIIYDHTANVGNLQLAPNGKIYGMRRNSNTLFSIDLPNASTTHVAPNTNAAMAQNQTDLGFTLNAIDSSGNTLTMGGTTELGLPNFTRIADDCLDGNCQRIADEVEEIINESFDETNARMAYCEEREELEFCQPADLPDLKPVINVIWKRSECDDIESTDIEPLHLTVSNPYSNVEFCNLTIHKVTIVKEDGSEIDILPNGDPSVTLSPIGPHCFGNIEGCAYKARELTLWTRGAIIGDYHIRIEGICYDICIHKDMNECVTFNICAD